MSGDPGMKITGIQPFDSAGPGDLTLAGDQKYLARLQETGASAAIVPLEATSAEKSLLRVENPKLAFARLLSLFHPRSFLPRGISPLASIGKGGRISERVSVYPFVFVGDQVQVGEDVTLFPGVFVGDRCVVGDGCVLHPNVVLYDDVRLGRRVIVHSGTVIGADGFGYVFDGQEQVKIPQSGRVIIGDDVEIGANSCIDRATFGATVIERGVKLDNHVHIGHNCSIGENTVMVAQVGISGSVRIGKNCILAGHAGVVDHITIGDDVSVMMKSAVSKDIPSGSVISGQPAMDHREWMKLEAFRRRLPQIYREWKQSVQGSDDDREED